MADRKENLRRSSRIKALPKNEDQNKNEGTRNRRRTPLLSNRSSNSEGEQTPDELTRELENVLENIQENRQKPTELYTEEKDVSGSTMYKFPTPLKSGGMAEKAALIRQQQPPPPPPSTPKTPKHKRSVITAETPHAYRAELKKKLASIGRRDIMTGLSSSESDNESESESVSEDEYRPPVDEISTEDETSKSETSEDSETQEEEEMGSDDSESDKKSSRINIGQTSTSKIKSSEDISTNDKAKRSNRVNYNDYHLKTDEYFESQSEKVITSDRTLGRLANPRLDEEKLQKLLSNANYMSKEHKQGIKSLSIDYRSSFPMWYFILEEGYSLLLHGLGSKRILINDFRKEILSDHPTLVVDGFFPSLTSKEILDGIIVDLLGLRSPSNPNECLNLIEKVLQDNPEDRLYLLIHNIDGLMLRSSKIQDTLSILASIQNLSVVASIDHINTPLIWDNVKHSRYNFCWWDVTTLLPYDAETSFESSIMVQRSGALALSSLVNVFQSLTTNARKIYVLLVKHQLDNYNNNLYLGMAFKDLYWGAREAFLVSSDLALRAQLTEFIDHKLVRTKRNYDGTEYLLIPLDNSLLKQFLEQQDNSE